MKKIVERASVGLFTLILCVGVAWSQQYTGGSHRISSPQGTLVVNSGYVSNFNVHTFHVYSFQFKPNATDEEWQQVPVMEARDSTEMKFMVTTANTADFTLRDAKVLVSGGKLTLLVAQKKYKETPYDDDAFVEVQRYELQKTIDEGRWVFRKISSRKTGGAVTVELALNPGSTTSGKR